MPWITKNGRRIFVGSTNPTKDNLNELNRQDEARKKLLARKIVETTKGYELNLGLNPSFKVKRETKVTETK
jgi:hypothetical protein